MRCRSRLAALPFVIAAGACTPYAVSTTALPMARGEDRRTITVSVVPNGAELSEDSTGRSAAGLAIPALDIEHRFGLDDHSDFGVRIPTASGLIVSYKRRLDGPTNRDSRATSIMVGAGVVNLGQHAHGEVTLITSGRGNASVIPYGGVRVIQVMPLSSSAVHDTPAIGAFTGLKLGGTQRGVSAELGVFYDRSALELRRGTVIVVPSFAIHGDIFSRRSLR